MPMLPSDPNGRTCVMPGRSILQTRMPATRVLHTKCASHLRRSQAFGLNRLWRVSEARLFRADDCEKVVEAAVEHSDSACGQLDIRPTSIAWVRMTREKIAFDQLRNREQRRPLWHRAGVASRSCRPRSHRMEPRRAATTPWQPTSPHAPRSPLPASLIRSTGPPSRSACASLTRAGWARLSARRSARSTRRWISSSRCPRVSIPVLRRRSRPSRHHGQCCGSRGRADSSGSSREPTSQSPPRRRRSKASPACSNIRSWTSQPPRASRSASMCLGGLPA